MNNAINAIEKFVFKMENAIEALNKDAAAGAKNWATEGRPKLEKAKSKMIDAIEQYKKEYKAIGENNPYLPFIYA